ncbi:MAG: hypothetical protein JXQ71_04085 [Verrucomicrobia bacterium]|nr:hypothetical protein [Verrucomicrobiota bacterium]
MKPLTFMVIAGEPSGDFLGAELVRQLRDEFTRRILAGTAGPEPPSVFFAPRFFGAGGPHMAAAGVELAFDLTLHAVVGVADVLKQYGTFRRLFGQLLQLAFARQPDAIICVDFSGFNRPFARAIRARLDRQRSPFANWYPRIIQYVSPQVWASRPWRARRMAQDLDLLLSIFPFEKEWFGRRVPRLRVEYVGHPIVDRHVSTPAGQGSSPPAGTSPDAAARVKHGNGLKPAGDGALSASDGKAARLPLVLLLPGSRVSELRQHVPLMLKTAGAIGADWPSTRFRMVLPDARLARLALEVAAAASRRLRYDRAAGLPSEFTADLGRFGLRTVEVRHGQLVEALHEATVAIASTGTVTMECAYFGMPAVAIYKTLWSNYQIARRLILVRHLSMPNILAGERIYPEFIQHAATPQNIAREALDLLENPERRDRMRVKLRQVIASLGPPGAGLRAARAVADLFLRRRTWVASGG